MYTLWKIIMFSTGFVIKLVTYKKIQSVRNVRLNNVVKLITLVRYKFRRRLIFGNLGLYVGEKCTTHYTQQTQLGYYWTETKADSQKCKPLLKIGLLHSRRTESSVYLHECRAYTGRLIFDAK